MKRNLVITYILSLFVFLLPSVNSFANKTSVKIITFEKVKISSEIIIKIEINHLGNTVKYITKWILVKINTKV